MQPRLLSQVMHFHADAYYSFGPRSMEWLLKREGKEADLPTVYQHIHGKSLWEHFRQDPESAMVFNKAMADVDSMSEPLHSFCPPFGSPPTPPQNQRQPPSSTFHVPQTLRCQKRSPQAVPRSRHPSACK